ncbi:MAG: peptide chain release factor 1 [Pseudomonadota bacterium]
MSDKIMSGDSHLQALRKRHEQLSQELAQPHDHQAYAELSREYKSLEPVFDKITEIDAIDVRLEGTQEILADPAMAELHQDAHSECEALGEQRKILLTDIETMLAQGTKESIPRILLEVRAGAGGDEAGLFAMDLLEMYQKIAARHGWKVEVLSVHENERGGCREAILRIQGDEAYDSLRFESGVHRVQRVPITESQGRIHTSAASVVVLPEPDEITCEIHDKDLRIDTFRASGAGGQHVNKTDSAVRITHIPSGIVVAVQDEKSQHKNKDRALSILRTRLMASLEQEQQAAQTADRREQIKSGDRSDRIRTYNFPQNRVTDHRVKVSIRRLDRLMTGEGLEAFWEELARDEKVRLIHDATT